MPHPLSALLLALFVALTGSWPVPAADLAGARQARAPAAQPPAEQIVSLPNRKGSLKFAVLGDFGTGARDQYQTAERMALVQKQFPFELVLLVGDNLYGSERPQDFRQKFEIPYKPLLDAKVKFYASLGNHDSREQREYPLFNMNNELYYTFKAPAQNVRFFALESTYPGPEQISWLEKELKSSNDDWKIAYFHHPPYSSGGRHGSDLRLRQTLEPLFVQYNVSVVFTGHDHFYERIKPQKDIVYFVTGSGGKLSPGDIRAGSPLTAKGFDTDYVFLVAEIVDDDMVFNAVARSGRVVDSGVIARRKPGPRPVAAPPAPPPRRP
jgi:predicted MPP superfamily phosphohydrolase